MQKDVFGTTGIITDIQRFSLSDGEGIRTTVFFKGCNMRCAWCHNPETISKNSELMFYESKCIGCGKCFTICPVNAHAFDGSGRHIIHRDVCTSCGKCTEVCYAQALSMCGREMSIDEIMEQVRQDKAYYKNSGGGVTLSGGEVLCHHDFAEALADACHAEGIDVAIETNMSVPFEKAVNLLKKVDLIMCDIKLFDDEAHKKYTGISNRIILENIEKTDLLGVPFIVRTPLIPGVTDGEENISAIANYIRNFKNLVRYEILNFNPLGEGKYKALGHGNAFEDTRPLGKDRLEELGDIVKKAGIAYKLM